MKNYSKLLIIFCLFAFFSASENHAGVDKKGKDKNQAQILSFGTVNAHWPISNGVNYWDADQLNSPFGPRYLSSSNTYDFHEGIDINTFGSSQPVHAFDEGTVHSKGNDSESGYWVKLSHTDGGSAYYTFYGHLTNDATYAALSGSVGSGDIIVNSGNTGGVNHHLHFAGMVGGTNLKNNAINPMRDDSLPYFDLFPLGVYITDNSRTTFTIETHIGYDELDLNFIDIYALNDDNSVFDYIEMNFDTRQGIDAKKHSGENGDEDGRVNGNTAIYGHSVIYDIKPQDYNYFNDQIMEFVVQLPSQWDTKSKFEVWIADTWGTWIYTETDIITGVEEPPPAPTNLYIQNASGVGQNPILKWTGSSQADTYNIYRRASFVQEWFIVPPGNTAATTYVDHTLTIEDPSEPEAYDFLYQVKALNGGGESGPSNEASVWGFSFFKQGEDKTKEIANESKLPKTVQLGHNYPNPFNPTTQVPFQLPEDAFVTIKIYSLMGREIKTLIKDTQFAGFHSVQWDGTNDYGQSVASGAYIIRFTANPIGGSNSALVFSNGQRIMKSRKILLLK